MSNLPHLTPELEQLPDIIEKEELELARLTDILNNPASYKDPNFDAKACSLLLQQQEEKIASLYLRWEELSEKSESL